MASRSQIGRASKQGRAVQLFRAEAITSRAVTRQLLKQSQTANAKSALLDGEIVALDEQGHRSFQMLQHRAILGKNRRVVIMRSTC